MIELIEANSHNHRYIHRSVSPFLNKHITCHCRVILDEHFALMTFSRSAPSACTLTAVDGDKSKYIFGGITFDCAPGTEFKQSKCGCVMSSTSKSFPKSEL